MYTLETTGLLRKVRNKPVVFEDTPLEAYAMRLRFAIKNCLRGLILELAK